MPAFAPDAKSQWQELDPELQELVLDELEEIAAFPPMNDNEVIRRDTVYQDPSARHYLFMRFVVDHKSVTLVGVYHHTSPRSEGNA
jgi:mRNA-degrading endonuclease RelE of RelBE toxin-antitoxin system